MYLDPVSCPLFFFSFFSSQQYPEVQHVAPYPSMDHYTEGPVDEPVMEDDEVEAAKKAKRALNRFNGMSVAEVMAKTLPDVITYNLDILIIGINPGLLSAYKGHHYPNPGNHFWKCLFLSGLTDQQLNYMHDQSLPEKYSIGFTNMVERTTPGSKDLSSKEIREGGRQLLEKLQKYKPLIAAFNGKGIYEIFCKETFGVKAKNLEFGLQPYKIPETETVCYLMPSSSPRCAQFPRAQDKVHFYIKLKELRDQMKGLAPSHEVEETEYSFDLQLAKGKYHSCTVQLKHEAFDCYSVFISVKFRKSNHPKDGRKAEWITACCISGVPSTVVSLPPHHSVARLDPDYVSSPLTGKV
uniref:G/T mismatch-specific thymine DNA glycosylase n=1 Tax=Neolamprologus brichardi TaxID=32507 RepID=A0A3Q4HJL2_NEOBR